MSGVPLAFSPIISGGVDAADEAEIVGVNYVSKTLSIHPGRVIRPVVCSLRVVHAG
jgi:hypothetical protein